MAHIRDKLDRTMSLCAAVVLLAAAVVSAAPLQKADAALALTNRKLQVTSTNPSDDLLAPDGSTYSGLAAGDPRNGAKVGHTYTFTVSTPGTIKGFVMSWCTTAFGYTSIVLGTTPCTSPTGFNAALAPSGVMSVNGGAGTTFTSTYNATDRTLRVTHATGVAVVANDVITLTFTPTGSNYFVNPTAAYFATDSWGTYFSHITTYSSDTTFTTPNTYDEGTVTNSIANSIKILTRVQETLKFSVGIADQSGGTAVVPEGATCAPLSGNSLTMGDSNNALSSSTAYFAHSYFRLSTNSANGTKVYYSGDTLKSGATFNITEVGAAAQASSPGTEQFGLTIDSTESGTPDKYSFAELTAQGAYTNPANYAFDDASITAPILIAQSTGIVQCDSGSVKYVANIAPNTEAGVYQTKLNYLVAPSY